jgi:hypothetical protein
MTAKTCFHHGQKYLSLLFVVVVRCSLLLIVRRSCLIRVGQSHTSRMGLSYSYETASAAGGKFSFMNIDVRI